MKVNVTTFSGQKNNYAAPGIHVIDMITDCILCYSTENLEEDPFNPWA